ncbi:hypothetical protein PRN20_18210 [Devosia sp. ZB163]|uniref:hypothetical protein n=1 Tax=Devosia sp. ZB163 TaxID=3025938 RepID=UPI00236058CC|nr:hypothetical protein [Devosia sp. ZB163]MDC9825672.1 hypothetical protein [Devosia sp. ZB163]
MADRKAYRQPQAGPQGFARTAKVFGDDIALVAADLALNKTVGLFVVPKGFVLTSLSVVVPDLDTGTPALVFAIGDAVDDDRFITGATTGQAGGTNTTLAASGLNYEFTEDTEIVWKTTTAAATAAAGTIKPRFFGYMK